MNDGMSPRCPDSTKTVQATAVRRLVLAGAGALGSALALQLTRQAAEQKLQDIEVVDPDMLEFRNVTLSDVFQSVIAQKGQAAFQQPKAVLLAEALTSNSVARWTATPVEIADVGWADLAAADLLVSCTDNVLARVEIAFVARHLGLPMLDGGLLTGDETAPDRAMEGRVSWFAPAPEVACYLCGLSEARRGEILTFAAASSLGCQPLPSAAAMGSYPEVPAMLQATAKLLADTIGAFLYRQTATQPTPASFEDSWAARLEPLSSASQASVHRLTPSSTCPWHGLRERLFALPDDIPIRDLLASVAGAHSDCRVQLTWPVCLRARCRLCGAGQDTAQRLAALRRRGVCVSCGAVAQLEALYCVSTVGLRDPEAALTFAQLGMPPRHLYRLRQTFQPCSQSDKEALA